MTEFDETKKCPECKGKKVCSAQGSDWPMNAQRVLDLE